MVPVWLCPVIFIRPPTLEGYQVHSLSYLSAPHASSSCVNRIQDIGQMFGVMCKGVLQSRKKTLVERKLN